MYTYLTNLKPKQALLSEAPSIAVSMFVAECFYKFHSFTLECLAFLLTWLAVSAAFSWGASLLAPKAAKVSFN